MYVLGALVVDGDQAGAEGAWGGSCWSGVVGWEEWVDDGVGEKYMDSRRLGYLSCTGNILFTV